MSKQTVTKDTKSKKLVVERVFNTSRAKLWQAWSDQNLLEKWWGPREWPATTKSFDFREGGHWHYCMTGPDGTQSWSIVDYIDIDAPSLISAEDSFSNPEGTKASDMPNSHWLVEFFGDKPSTLKTTLLFSTETDLQKIIDMGFESAYSESLDRLEEAFEKMNAS